ncbi:MAG: O-antigen ligase family protein [Flavobacteriales bacterium]|nr:O-antigen ligase family protein [Flavobacteriales bacterium]
MNLVVNRANFNQLLFIICVIVPFFNIYEFSFVTWVFAIFLTLRKNYSLEFIKYTSIFVLLFLLAIIVGRFFEYQTYFIIRDITYLLKPITGLLLGYQLFTKHIKNPFQFIVYAGLSIACYHLFLVFYGIVVEGAKNVREIREHAGYFNDFEVYTLVILIFSKQLNLGFSKNKTRLFILILAISSFFYLARTNFIQFIVLVAALKGFLVLNVKSLKVVLGIVIATLMAYSAIYYYNPRRNGKGMDEFLYKIKIIPTEAFSTKIDRFDWKDFNDNYRSYENIRTVQQLNYNENLIFGEGAGSQVDLKQKLMLGDMLLRHISILHNGYMTVLLKTGLLGLSIYLLSIFFFFRKERSSNPILKNIHYIFVGTGVFLILSNWVFLGLYNQIDTKSLLIGFLFAYKNEILKTTES